MLTIKGEKKGERVNEKAKVYRQETWEGSFQRTVALPATVDAEKVEATYACRGVPREPGHRRGCLGQVYTLDDTIDPAKIDAVLEAGVLNLTLHRKEAVKPRKINVRS